MKTNTDISLVMGILLVVLPLLNILQLSTLNSDIFCLIVGILLVLISSFEKIKN